MNTQKPLWRVQPTDTGLVWVEVRAIDENEAAREAEKDSDFMKYASDSAWDIYEVDES